MICARPATRTKKQTENSCSAANISAIAARCHLCITENESVYRLPFLFVFGGMFCCMLQNREGRLVKLAVDWRKRALERRNVPVLRLPAERRMPAFKSTYSLIPRDLDLTCQILLSVGKLVAVWGNCESCFYGIYFCLAGRSNGNADVTWASIYSTRKRMEILHNLVRYDADLPEDTKAEIFGCLAEFDALTLVRNFYCHARYNCEEDDETIVSIEQWGLAPIRKPTDPIFKEKSRPATKDTVNQICSTADRIVELSRRVSRQAYRVRDCLKLDHLNWPPLPPD